VADAASYQQCNALENHPAINQSTRNNRHSGSNRLIAQLGPMLVVGIGVMIAALKVFLS